MSFPVLPGVGQLESQSMQGPCSSTSCVPAPRLNSTRVRIRAGTWAWGAPVPVRRDQGRGGSQGGMSRSTRHCQRGALRWEEAVLTWGRSCSPRGGQGRFWLSQGRPLALSGMGARMLNDLGCSGPSGTLTPTPQQPSEDHDSSFQQQQH